MTDTDDECADDQDYLDLQYSFDAGTHVTSSIRQVAISLQALPNAIGLKELVAKGIKLCKEVVEPQNKVEQLLCSERGSISKKEVTQALKTSGPPYYELVKFYNEIISLNQHYGGAKKFKAIAQVAPPPPKSSSSSSCKLALKDRDH